MVHVLDGDTVYVLDASLAQHKVRVAGIDAPKRGQPFSRRAKERMAELVAGKEVEADGYEVYLMSKVLITGSNRGLGLEWVRQCAGRGWRVFATCGDPDRAMDLRDLAEQMPSVSLHRLDVTDAGQASDLAEDLRGETIDLLVNNAGACFDTHISALPAVVSEVAEVKPHKRRRLRVLARERRDLLEALERTGLILAHHW